MSSKEIILHRSGRGILKSEKEAYVLSVGNSDNCVPLLTIIKAKN